MLRLDVLLLAVGAALAEVGLRAAIAFRMAVGFAFAQSAAMSLAALIEGFGHAVARWLRIMGVCSRGIVSALAIYPRVRAVAAIGGLTFVVGVESGFLVYANFCAMQ